MFQFILSANFFNNGLGQIIVSRETKPNTILFPFSSLDSIRKKITGPRAQSIQTDIQISICETSPIKLIYDREKKYETIHVFMFELNPNENLAIFKGYKTTYLSILDSQNLHHICQFIKDKRIPTKRLAIKCFECKEYIGSMKAFCPYCGDLTLKAQLEKSEFFVKEVQMDQFLPEMMTFRSIV